MKNRNILFDLLRSIAIILIILAHTNPPGIVFQIRNFDVILLIIISGFFAQKTLDNSKSLKKYYLKRLLRIVIPVWTFLAIYYLIAVIVLKKNIIVKNCIDAFTFGESFGYIWIFRIYIITIIVAPLVHYLANKINSDIFLSIIISIIFILQFVVSYIIGTENALINWLVIYTIQYSAIFSFGFLLEKLSLKKLLVIILLFFIIFVLQMNYYYHIYGKFITTNQYKYPPELYYISYGLFGSFLLYYILLRSIISEKVEKVLKCKDYSKIVTFIGSHTMWIYLWHIPIVKLFNYLNFENWEIKFIIILTSSLLITKFQEYIINKTKNHFLIRYYDC